VVLVLHAADLIEYAARHDGQSGLPDLSDSSDVNAQAQPVRNNKMSSEEKLRTITLAPDQNIRPKLGHIWLR
jgi:hypothetical protein